MHPREFLEANLDAVERAIAVVCAQASLRGADAEDFGSAAKLALLENDCAIIRKWERRSSFETYVTIVLRRLLVDQRRAGGRWYASASVQRQGDVAVLLERLITRDRRAVDEALAIARQKHPDVPPAQLAAMVAALPERTPRPRLVAIAEGDEERFVAADAADERAEDLDRQRRSETVSRVVQAAMQTMSAEDRVILRLRFKRQATIAEISRAMDIPQRPLYRRMEALLAALRHALERAGLDATAVTDLIGEAGQRLDFHLDRKSGPFPPSLANERSGGEL